MDRDDLFSDRAQGLIGELNDLILLLRKRNLAISSWYGLMDLSGFMGAFERRNRGYHYDGSGMSVDDRIFPWFLYWEIIWVLLNNEFSPGMSVLDLGGSSSLFSYYLASKGLDVTTVDLQKKLVDNGNAVAGAMGWKLANHAMDMRTMSFSDRFDHITSLCVYEHIPLYRRVEINRTIAGLLKDNGRFSITFDFRNPMNTARIGTPQAVHDQFIAPSGLQPRGNPVFNDNGKSYLLHPHFHDPLLLHYKIAFTAIGHFGIGDFFKTKKEDDYTFGALFLKK